MKVFCHMAYGGLKIRSISEIKSYEIESYIYIPKYSWLCLQTFEIELGAAWELFDISISQFQNCGSN